MGPRVMQVIWGEWPGPCCQGKFSLKLQHLLVPQILQADVLSVNSCNVVLSLSHLCDECLCFLILFDSLTNRKFAFVHHVRAIL